MPRWLQMRLSFREFFYLLVFSVINVLMSFYFIHPADQKLSDVQSDQLQCRFCKQCRTSTHGSCSDDYVFLFFYEKGLHIQTSIRSILSTGFRGKIVVFTHPQMKDVVESSLTDEIKCGVILESTELQRGISAQFTKYVDSLAYISSPNFTGNRILLVEKDRLFFFEDPFLTFYNPNRLYSLRRPIAGSSFVISSGFCGANLSDEIKEYYDPAFIAGGEYNVKRFISAFTATDVFKMCKSRGDDTSLLTHFGVTRAFQGFSVHFMGVDPSESTISLVTNHVLDGPPYPPIAIDWASNAELKEMLENQCK